MEVNGSRRLQKTTDVGNLQKDRVEPKGYVDVYSEPLGEMKEMYRESASLMRQVVRHDNLTKAIQTVRRNKGVPGIDDMTVDEVEGHIVAYYEPLKEKLLKGTYTPQPVKRVEIPKANGGIRKLGIPVVRDRVIQQAVRQIIEPIIDPEFAPNSHGFRPKRSTHTALKQCAGYYKAGFCVAVDCDLKQCFDTLNHDKLMYYFEQYIQDKAISSFIRKCLQSGVIDLSGEFIESRTGAPQGGVISPLLCNVYLHELDKELIKRGHRFVRYADDFVIFVKSRRAGDRVLNSVTRFIETDLKLKVNEEKSKVGASTRLKFLSCLIMKVNGVYRFRPANQAKQEFKATLKRLTRRNRPGTFQQIVKAINQVTMGWINYFGQGFIKGFIKTIEPWLHRRIRQLILKRWKKSSTKIRMLKRYGLDADSAKRIAYSRKKYWCLSKTSEMHNALTTERLYQWGLAPLNQLAESAYARY